MGICVKGVSIGYVLGGLQRWGGFVKWISLKPFIPRLHRDWWDHDYTTPLSRQLHPQARLPHQAILGHQASPGQRKGERSRSREVLSSLCGGCGVQGEEQMGPNVSGHLCVGQPWPGMARTIYGDHEKFLDVYYRHYPGLYFSGDGALRDADGNYQITGRVDDVINVKGHRIGTAEIESYMVSLGSVKLRLPCSVSFIQDHDPRVAETAVVGRPHDVYGEGKGR